ncbi:MAG: hypothetical protein ACK5NN_00695 [Sphingomonadaceae bacterium]
MQTSLSARRLFTNPVISAGSSGKIHMEGIITGAPRGCFRNGFQLSRGITGKELHYGGTYRHNAGFD